MYIGIEGQIERLFNEKLEGNKLYIDGRKEKETIDKIVNYIITEARLGEIEALEVENHLKYHLAFNCYDYNIIVEDEETKEMYVEKNYYRNEHEALKDLTGKRLIKTSLKDFIKEVGKESETAKDLIEHLLEQDYSLRDLKFEIIGSLQLKETNVNIYKIKREEEGIIVYRYM